MVFAFPSLTCTVTIQFTLSEAKRLWWRGDDREDHRRRTKDPSLRSG